MNEPLSNPTNEMLIKISIDIWRDVFEWFAPTDRKQLALKFNELGDSQFSDICQKWLHEWTKNVCIGALKIDSMKDGQLAPLLHSWDERRQAFEIVPFAEAELPDNIVDFEQLKISHLDTEVLQFIQRMQPVFQNVHLQVQDADSLGSSQTTLGHLMPLFSDGGIDKLTIFPGQFLSAFRDQFPAQFLAINVLDVWPIFMIDAASAGQLFDLFLNWLGTRRQDGEPRVLTLDDFFDDVRPLVERIREHFRNAADPATFFIWIDSFEREPGVQGSTTNATTNEQLVVREYVDGSSGILLIGRCSAELDGPVWVEEMDRKFGWVPESEKAEIWEKARRLITISSPTLGPIEGESRPEENADTEEVAVDELGPGRAGN